jgi:hypothetical protein
MSLRKYVQATLEHMKHVKICPDCGVLVFDHHAHGRFHGDGNNLPQESSPKK